MIAGTLVLLSNDPTQSVTRPRNGSIGEIICHKGKTDWYIEEGNLVVSFPRFLSPHPTGYWQYPKQYLIPISGPDIEIEDDMEAPVDEKLLESIE